MAYKWKPNATQRREYAEKMSDPIQRAAIEQKREVKAEKRRHGSKFDYNTAGGSYVPTKAQYDFAAKQLPNYLTKEQDESIQQVIYGYTCNERVHHDHIHVVNELIRSDISR